MTHSELANKLNDYAENITINEGNKYRIIPHTTIETALVHHKELDVYMFNFEKQTSWSKDKWTQSSIILCETKKSYNDFMKDGEQIFLLDSFLHFFDFFLGGKHE